MHDAKVDILLADDDFGFRFPLTALLEDIGYEVVPVSESEGIRRHYDSVDVLVLDVRLPTNKLEGIGVAAALRNSEEPSRWKPIIFMSVIGRDECAAKLRGFPGQYDWIVKPFEIESLDHLIKRMLVGQKGSD